MIVRGLANTIIKDFHYRHPNESERLAYETTLKSFINEGGATGGPRPNDIAIFAAKIESSLTDLLITEFKSPNLSYTEEKLTREQKIAKIMQPLLENLSYSYNEPISNLEGPLKTYLKKIESGFRTAVLIIALMFKMLAKFFSDVTMATAFTEPLINNSYSTINEIAGLPQTGMLHPFINFLCGEEINSHLSTNAIIDKRFDINKFAFEDTEIGVSEKAYEEFKRLYEDECKKKTIFAGEMTLSQIYEQGKQIPIFGCPAKRAYINLEQFNLGKVNFVKAMYLLAQKKCSSVFDYL